MAEVNDKGEVTVEGEFVGRLEGFRFHQDASATGDEAKTLKTAATAALAPEFHLRADRFYNAPDTEMDFTEQGGLMWGEHAIGKLAAGDDILKPRVQFLSSTRKPVLMLPRKFSDVCSISSTARLPPCLSLYSKSRTTKRMTGMARGFGFQMVEALGIIDRRDVART